MELCCPYCFAEPKSSENKTRIVRFGFYRRLHDKKSIQRFFCKSCQKSFSTSSNEPTYCQHKPELNSKIMLLLCSQVSQRRAAKILCINRKTVVRKFLFMGAYAKLAIHQWNSTHSKSEIVEFDDLETFEHTKLKPISITLAVEHKTRRILCYSTSRMPAKGLLVQKSLKKYGKRKDERSLGRKTMFEALKFLVKPSALFKSDQNPHYPQDMQYHFPHATHSRYLGRKGSSTGFGEIKKGGFDPLFSLNHTCAMLRANINRLARKTWCTSKKIECLDLHIALYVLYHNLNLKLNP